MNFYPFYAAEYRAATAHLSDSEDLAYRRMLDLYYEAEEPLDPDVGKTARLIRMPAEIVSTVLAEFFSADETGRWHHARCDSEIEKYQRIRGDRSIAGKASAAKRASKAENQQVFNTCSTPVQHVSNNLELDVNASSKPPQIKESLSAPHSDFTLAPPGASPRRATSASADSSFDVFWEAYPRKIGKLKAAQVWSRSGCARRLKAILEAVERQRGSRQWLEDGGRFIPHPATWLSQGRWDDQPDADHTAPAAKAGERVQVVL